MYIASHPRTQSGPTSAGFIGFSWRCENQTSMPYTEFLENNEENISSYFQKFGGNFYAASHRNFMTEPEVDLLDHSQLP